ncbi:MAG: UbiX family flavin prenyltransferase [Rickettsiaceae bacterium]|nr:UbiX family flavin prenyltransferase [Rickettsiaceae bacterium]
MKKINDNKLIIAITGASGSIYGIRLLEYLKRLKIETHLILSKSALITINTELDYKISEIKSLADYNYHPNDIAAKISSGSFRVSGMIIAPCSMNTLAQIAGGYESNLISRAASVIIKERKKLALMVRETPLDSIHLENMLKLSNCGVNIFPPVPAFYNHPKSLDDIVNHSIARLLDLFDIDIDYAKRWEGIS